MKVLEHNFFANWLGMTKVLPMLQSLSCLATTSLQHDLVDLI